MDALQVAYQAAVQRMPGIAFDAFASALEGADLHPVCVDGKCVGALIVKGCEIHASVLPEARGRWVSRQLLRVLVDVVRKHGRAETSATTPDGVAFVQRLGFVPVADKWVMYGH
jgi:GNAT superfamily N-acetyltransferase